MRSTSRIWLAMVSLGVVALGCAAPAAAETRVLVTIKPVHSLVAAIMAGEPAPELLIDGAASPHTYALRPSDVRRLGEARVIVRVSEQLESFLAKPLAVIGDKARIVTLDRLAGMTLLALRETGGDDGHGHGHSEQGMGGQGMGGHHHDGPIAGGAGVDPHLWLDPVNARVAVAAIADILSAASPADAERYRRNAMALAARLEQLDSRLEAELAPLRGRPFLVFHDAYQYFEHRYGLADAGAVTINPEVPPSARHVSRLRARLTEAKVACVFAEPQFPPRTAETIVEGTGVRLATLDPLGAATAAGAEQYFGLMQGLARDLVRCLAP